MHFFLINSLHFTILCSWDFLHLLYVGYWKYNIMVHGFMQILAQKWTSATNEGVVVLFVTFIGKVIVKHYQHTSFLLCSPPPHPPPEEKWNTPVTPLSRPI